MERGATHIAAFATLLRRDVTTSRMPPRELQVLGTIVAHGPLSVRDIAARVVLSGSQISRIVDRLVARRLIDRSREELADRRLTVIVATALGRALDMRVREKWNAAIEEDAA